MRIIDSHIHVWTNDPQYPWAPGEKELPVNDASPEACVDLLSRMGVSRAVLVQYVKYRWDNRYVSHVIKTYPHLFMGVCRVDPQSPLAPDRLSYWTETFGFRGVRISPTSSAQDDWFCGSQILNLFQRAADLKVPVIILTQPSRLEDLFRILERIPEVEVVIDHMADCLNHDGEDLHRLINLARYPGVYLKIGHIPHSSSKPYPWPDTHAMLEKVFEAYGSQRVMWGSDWPFLLNNMTYEQSISFVNNELKFLTPIDREWIFHKTSLRFWPFDLVDDSGGAYNS